MSTDARESSEKRAATRSRRMSRYIMLLPTALLVIAGYYASSWAQASGMGMVPGLMIVPVFIAAWTIGRVGAVLTALAGTVCIGLAGLEESVTGPDFSLGAFTGTTVASLAITLATLLAFGEVVHMLRGFRDRNRQLQSRLARIQSAQNNTAQLDPITRLLSEAAVRRRLSEEVLRATRYGHSLSLLYIDLDGSTTLTENEGEERLHECLQILGKLVKDVSRASDVAGRIDEDECIVVLVETGYGAAAVVAERLRAAMISSETLRQSSLTASFGVVSWPDADSPSTTLTGDALLEAARKAMVLAKEQGGDRIVASTL